MAESNTLFNGIKFWLARKIPLRSKFVDDIEKHGGIVVPVDRLADMLIVDHLLKDHDLPQNNALYSYRFIELSVRNGKLEDKEKYHVERKPTSIRPVGDQTQSTRTMRVPFTKADDDFLLDWISKSRQPLQGDRIFKDLEAVNNRHTWQSWRARWVKRLRNQPPTEQPERPVATSPALVPGQIASTAPLAHKDHDHKPLKEVSRTQEIKTTVDKTASSTHRSITYNHDPDSSARKTKSVNHRSEQYRPRSFRNIAPKPSHGETPLGPDQNRNSTDPKTDSEQFHAMLARPTNDAKQSTNGASAPMSQPLRESADRVTGQPSSKSLQNDRSDVLSTKSVNGTRRLPSPGQIPSVTASRQMEGVHNVQPITDHQTLAGSRHALSGMPGLPNSSREPPSEDIEQLSQTISAETKKRRPSYQVAEDDSTGDIPADPISGTSDEPSNTHDIRELLWHEEVAVQIWTDLLKHVSVADIHLSEGTPFLLANAKIIRDLDEEAFRAAWNIWWQSRPEKTEEEWAEHFNQFCLPFWAKHSRAFQALFQHRLKSKLNRAREGRAAEVYGDIGRTARTPKSPELGSHKHSRKAAVRSEQVTTPVRAYRAEASPELGSKTYDTQQLHELESIRSQQFATDNSTAAGSLLKRAHSSSEVPESPRSPQDTDTIISKRYKTETYNKGSINDRRISTNKPTGGSHFSRTLKSAVGESSDENEETENKLFEGLTRKTYQGRRTSPTAGRGDVEVQANIDRQLWLEEEDAEQAEGISMERQKLPANHSRSIDNLLDHITEDKDYTLKPRQVKINNAKKGHGLQPVGTPEPPSVSELSEQSNVPYQSKPFYEASKSAIQGDFQDLMSQMTKLPAAASFVSHPNILPSIEEKGAEIPESNKHTHTVDNDSESEGKQEGISEWTQRKLRKGHSDEILTLVLNASMMDVNLARKALPYYQKFNRLPNTKSGIWTEEDDKTLLTHSRKAKRALISKHGKEALDKRREYLETMKLGK